MSNLMHENFLSNKENLNGFDDTMDEPMEIDPSTPFANKIRQTIRPQESNQIEATNVDAGLKEQQATNGPKIVKPGPKIVKPVVVAPKVVRPNGGLPVPQINDADFDNIDPFKTKSKIGFDTTEFQSPGNLDLRLSDETANETNAGAFNLRLSDETINETNAGGFHLRLDETNNCSMLDNQIDPFKTKTSIMNSPPRQQSPAKSNLFKSPPPPPIFSTDNLNSNSDEITTSSEVSSQQNIEGMNDEWETHQKRSSSSRNLNNSLTKQNRSPLAKQSMSALSSNTDLSSSENVLSSPPASGNKLGLSTSPSTESHSESTSVYSSNTASTSSINNKHNEGGIENEQAEESAPEPTSVWTAPKEKSPSKEPTPAPEVQPEPQPEKTMEPTPVVEAETTAELTATTTKTTTNQDIDNEVMNQLNNFKANNFVTSSRGEAPATSEPATGNLLDFGDFDNKPSEANNTNNTEANGEDKSTVDNVVFDSIFSSDTDFNSFLDLLEKKEVDNSVKNSPKYSEFARKSLYLQFDPITQLKLANQLSPEKVKRLSIIVDKKKAIKNYLCDIKETVVEDETETESNEQLAQAAENKLIDVISSDDKQLVTTDKEQEFTATAKTEEKSDMIISNSANMDLIGETGAETFSKKLDLNEERLDEVCDKIDDEERPKVDDNVEDDFIEKKIQPVSNESRASLERSKPSDLSFKLITDDSMMLDESQLINIKSNRPSEITQSAVLPAVNTNRSSTEDLSSSSVCMSSASNAEVSKMMAELAELREREKVHLKRIDSLEVENEKFKTVAVDFEEIFKNLIQEKEECEVKLKNEIIELTKERDHLQEDVIGVERAFDDLHRRFEKLKTKVEEFKKNEESLTNAIDVYKQQLDKEKNKYSTLKKHAEEKIEFANTEIEKVRKGSANELQRLQAELRKAEIKISSLDLSVAQKDQENSQLTNLLEDLLQKVKP